MKAKLIFLILVVSVTYSFAQKRVADKFYKNYSYIKAAELYEQAVKKGDSSSNTLTKLANCYFNNANPKKAAQWYKVAIRNSENLDTECVERYVQSLRSVGEYEEAEEWLQKIPNKTSLNTVNYTKLQELHQDSIRINNLDINTKNSDFGAYVHKQKIIFSSAKNTKGKVYPWNNQPYLDLYEATVNNYGEGTTIENTNTIASDKINTAFHESNIAITNDGKTLYFTRNNLNRRNKLDYDKEGTSHLKIFKASLINNKWDNIVELPFNDEVFSNGHPALSPDNKTLYFTSNRPDGFGETDIYKVAILDDGTYGIPVNLGDKINTSGKEMFPFVAKDYTFYFSSDGYENLGFLDVFKSDILKNNSSEVTNIGAPYNSGYDDFAFFMNDDGETGYFSSNRPGGKGQDDIYSFYTYNCKQIIHGKTYDDKTKEILANTLVELIDASGKVISSITTKEDGVFEFEVECETKYTLKGTKSDYKPDTKFITTSNIKKLKTEYDLYLTPLIIDNEIVIDPIFFDFDKWNIRPDAAYELEHIVDVMKNHPKMIIKIEAHTDSRGEDEYNEVLSDKRAKSTRDYILSRGIATQRIESAIGFGEKQLVNKCANNVPCTEDEHQENRRSKFIILNDYD